MSERPLVLSHRWKSPYKSCIMSPGMSFTCIQPQNQAVGRLCSWFEFTIRDVTYLLTACHIRVLSRPWSFRSHRSRDKSCIVCQAESRQWLENKYHLFLNRHANLILLSIFLGIGASSNIFPIDQAVPTYSPRNSLKAAIKAWMYKLPLGLRLESILNATWSPTAS